MKGLKCQLFNQDRLWSSMQPPVVKNCTIKKSFNLIIDIPFDLQHVLWGVLTSFNWIFSHLKGTSTNVGRYIERTVQTSDVTQNGQYKRRTLHRTDSTNVGLYIDRTVQTSDWDKRQTSTNFGPVQTSDRYQYKRRTLHRSDITNVGRYIDRTVQTSDGYIHKNYVGLWWVWKKNTA